MKFTNSKALRARNGLAAPKILLALISASVAVLMACGGDATGSELGEAANNASPSAVSQSAGPVQAVSLSMDDYLGSTVVLYFSFPG